MMKRIVGGVGILFAAALICGRAAGASLATYEVTFESTWSQATHPNAWPSGGAHFSPLIGGTHNASARFWRDGGAASPGIEAMAERGATGTLRSEVEARIADGAAHSVIAGGGIGTSPGRVSTTFQIDSDHPLVSLVSMVAPSPDWFVGVDSLALFGTCGRWRDRVVVPLAPFDAGTDDGPSFGSPDAESTPHTPIARLGGPFAGGPASLGTFEFRLVSVSDAPAFESDAGLLAASASSGAGVVPEPGAGALATLGLLLLVRRRARRARARADGRETPGG
jgi:hypothetical protein